MFLSKFKKVLIKLIKMILGEKIIKSTKYGKLSVGVNCFENYDEIEV